VAHGFLLFIVAILIYRGPGWARRSGGALAIGFIVLRLYDAHDRSSIVALMAAVAMVGLLRARAGAFSSRDLIRRVRRHKGKAVVGLAATLGMTWFLIIRGHSSIADVESYDWAQGQMVLRRNDTAMLPVFYVTSQLAETQGYDYALPLLNRALFGWLPRRYFPWKDDMPDLFLDVNVRRNPPSVDAWLYGAKDTVLGSFYRHGGVVAVVLGMALLGLLLRRLDRLVAAGKTDLARAVGVVWLSNLWMMFASNDIWILGNVFINGMPFFALYAVTRFESAFPSSFSAGTLKRG